MKSSFCTTHQALCPAGAYVHLEKGMYFSITHNAPYGQEAASGVRTGGEDIERIFVGITVMVEKKKKWV